jgi:hypothetical protein
LASDALANGELDIPYAKQDFLPGKRLAEINTPSLRALLTTDALIIYHTTLGGLEDGKSTYVTDEDDMPFQVVNRVLHYRHKKRLLECVDLWGKPMIPPMYYEYVATHQWSRTALNDLWTTDEEYRFIQLVEIHCERSFCWHAYMR